MGGKAIHKVSCEVSTRVGGAKLWVENVEDQEELKRAFQWNYGYWPDDIKVTEVMSTVEGT